MSLYKNAVFILDAYDEIKDVNKDEFVRELKKFIADYPNIPLIISSRINFEDKNNFSDFQPLYLEALSYNDIYDYLSNNQVGERHLFIEKANVLDVFELLHTPFYLKEMLKYYLSHNDLPKTKSELYQILIDESFEIDEKHKQNRGYVQKLKTKGYKILQKVAFVMTVCEKKELSEEELTEITSDSEEFQLIVHFSVFKRNALETSYSFEHIAFKEFLVANFLTTISSKDVSQLIFYPDSTKLINSWYNIVLLFLEIIQEEHEKFQSIIDILLENNKHIIVEASPKFLKKSNRIEIFKKIYNDYKSKGIYIDYFEFRKNLMAFANYQETVLFLLEQLKSESSNANYYNALILLEYADYSKLSDKESVKQILIDFLSLKLNTYELRNYILLPFQYEVYANERDVEDIWHVIKDSKQPEILNDFLELLLKLDNVDKYADWIFSTEKYIHIYTDNDGVSHSIYRTDLYDIFNKFNNTENIRKALKCLASEHDFHEKFNGEVFNRKRTILLKLEVRFLKTGNNSIVEDVLNAFEKEEFSLYNLDKSKFETATLYKNFFKGTNLTEKILNDEFIVWEEQASNNRIDHNRELLIPLLITEDIFIDKMKSFDKNDSGGYWLLRNYLPVEEPLRTKLSGMVEEYFTFERPKFPDWNVENQKDFDLVLNYDKFKEKIEFHLKNKCEYIYENKDRIKRNKNIIIESSVEDFFRKCTKNKIIDSDLARKRIDDLEYYQRFFIYHISSTHTNLNYENITIQTSEKQKELIRKVIFRFIDEDEITLNNILSIVSLIVFYDFELSDEQIIKILPYSYHNFRVNNVYKRKIKKDVDEWSYSINILDVLISKSTREVICNGIVEITNRDMQYHSELYLCFGSYIIENKIAELYYLLPIILTEKIEVDRYREHHQIDLLVKIAEIENSFSLIEKELDKLSNNAKLYYYKHLKGDNRPKGFCDLLNKLYIEIEGEDKIDCLGVLLSNSCDGALEEFVSYLKKSDTLRTESFFGLSYEKDECLDLLLEALEILLYKTYDFDNRLIDVVLYSIERIAVRSKENYHKVEKRFVDIAQKNNKYSFLYKKLQTFEETLYETHKMNRSISSVKVLYEELKFRNSN